VTTAQPAESGQSAAKEVGAEGYGPHIFQALTTKDPNESWLALSRLRRCDVNREMQTGMERMRSVPGLPPETVAESIRDLQVEERRCQTVEPSMRQRHAELALNAMQGNILGAAHAYAQESRFELPAELQADVVAAMRADAESGDLSSMMTLAMVGNRWGMPAEEQMAYEIAVERLAPPSQSTMTAWVSRLSRVMSANEERSRAEARAERLVRRAREAGGGQEARR
jgi:hypothetical protein